MSQEYWQWVRAQAALIESDGCTGVADIHVECCYEHDLAYRTGRDPRVAFEKGWDAAPEMSKAEADARLKGCIRQRSPFRWLSPMALWRWAAVRLFGDYDKQQGSWLKRLGAKISPSPAGEKGDKE